MDLITVTSTANTINVVATSPLNAFTNSVGMKNTWYGLLVDLGISRDKVVALKDIHLTVTKQMRQKLKNGELQEIINLYYG